MVLARRESAPNAARTSDVDALIELERQRIRSLSTNKTETTAGPQQQSPQKSKAEKFPIPNIGGKLGFMVGIGVSLYAWEWFINAGLQALPNGVNFLVLPVGIIGMGLTTVAFGWAGMKAYDSLTGKTEKN
jgi:hypothetical protein